MSFKISHTLLVEDDAFQSRLVAGMLQTMGATRISYASNGRQALEMLEGASGEPVDLILCDLQMPQMDGMEFLRHFGQMQREVAVIILSALDSRLLASVAKMARLYNIRLLGTIEKPVTVPRLKELFARVLQPAGDAARSDDMPEFTLAEVLQGIRSGQFEPYFQAKVRIDSCRLIGAEALARWIHPVHGVVGPAAFIPILENSGNIDELTLGMLGKTARYCRSLHEQGHHLSISVNLSLSSLEDPELSTRLTHLVRSSGLDPQYIILEITETTATTEGALALENLARLSMNGFPLSIDDYGTGYSSLQQLTRIGFHELKIDQGFVRDLLENESLRIVVNSSIDMARKLKIRSVAEGIETAEDWKTLHEMKCDVGQGYLIGKPMDVRAFSDFVERFDAKAQALRKIIQGQQDPRILIVEDDAFTRRLFLRMVQELGFRQVQDADSAQTALRLFESEKFDLLITDIDMPGMNGLELIQSIRSGKTHSRADLRIIVLSAVSQIHVISAALALDINGFLIKPVTPATTEEKITNALTERLHLHSPIAYASINTRVGALSSADSDDTSRAAVNAAIVLPEASAELQDGPVEGARLVPFEQLCPGMVLQGRIHLETGALILSPGRVLTEAVINRLRDIRKLLKEKNFLILQDALE